MSIFSSIRNFFSRKSESTSIQPVYVPEPAPAPIPAPVAAEPVDPHPPMKMGDYNYVWNPAGGSGGQYEIYVSPEEQAKAKAAWAAAHPVPQLIAGKTKLPNGAIYMGNNRYGLPADSQKRVYDEAMNLWKSSADPAKLTLILSRLTEPFMFDAQVYPDLHALVMYYLTNHSLPPCTAK